jgi:hypothetical protein
MSQKQPTTPILTLSALAEDQWGRLDDGRLVLMGRVRPLGGGYLLVAVLDRHTLIAEAMDPHTPCTPLQSVTLSATWTPMPGG